MLLVLSWNSQSASPDTGMWAQGRWCQGLVLFTLKAIGIQLIWGSWLHEAEPEQAQLIHRGQVCLRSSVPQAGVSKGNPGASASPRQELSPFGAKGTEQSNLNKVFRVMCCCYFYEFSHWNVRVFQRNPQNSSGLSPLASLWNRAATCSSYLSTHLITRKTHTHTSPRM